jgi:Sulfotransferase domain
MAGKRNSNPGRAGRLPDFIGVGPPRTGTTWLHGVLHRRACLPAETKETWFFDRYYDRGLDWYRDFFRRGSCDRPVGELGPTYFANPRAHERIRRDLPGCRIICTLRDPLERAYSWYRLRRRLGIIRTGFEEALLAGDDPHLREASRYATYLGPWRDSFGAENVGVFLYDDLQSDPQAYADAIARFIGVGPVAITPALSRHLIRNNAPRDCRNPRLAYSAHLLRRWMWAHRMGRTVDRLTRLGFWKLWFDGGREFQPVPPEVESRLRKIYAAEIDALEEMIGRDLSAWKRPAADQPSAAPELPTSAPRSFLPGR